MSTTQDTEDQQDLQAKRLSDLTILFESALRNTRRALDLMQKDEDVTQHLIRGVAELNRLDAELIKAEQAVQERHGDPHGPDALDFDELRAELGRILDRIRHVRGAEGVPEEPDGATTGGAPL